MTLLSDQTTSLLECHNGLDLLNKFATTVIEDSSLKEKQLLPSASISKKKMGLRPPSTKNKTFYRAESTTPSQVGISTS